MYCVLQFSACCAGELSIWKTYGFGFIEAQALAAIATQWSRAWPVTAFNQSSQIDWLILI
jgi:hypothetical protein